MRFLSLAAVAVFLGCVATTPTAPTPIPTPTISAPASSPCETVMQTYCAKGGACGNWPYESCAAIMVTACSEIVGITASEAGVCSEALIAMSCDAVALPPVCLSIGVLRGEASGAPPVPGVSL